MPLPPRGLSRVEAAGYVGVGATHFDALVEQGVMPRPGQRGGRRVWDPPRLDTAFEALQPDAPGDPYADVR